ncbi:MAG: hypothetical protein HZA59_11925 [Hydrogenophilales bacterium]|nr:hypothetical protein [Hydrogenophilales bacterium]
MKPIPTAYWHVLDVEFDGQLISTIASALASSDPIFLTVQELGAELDVQPEKIRALLDRLVRDGYLAVQEDRRCPNCGNNLTREGELDRRCSCGYTFPDGALPELVRTYMREGHRSRDVRWVITVHGMNTPGEWQQNFSWRLAQLYGYAVPVGIYKYGNIKLSPLIPYRQNLHRDRLLRYLTRLRNEMKAAGYGERCDVIAHSFGTWLLTQAMLADRSADPVKLGRVILTGSIVRPDFQWDELLNSGRIEAVMCHYGARDIPVRAAQYFIPDSGPSGRYGFNNQANIIHKLEPMFGHSDYFEERHLSRVMKEKWAPFLTWPAIDLADWGDQPNKLTMSPWSGSRWRWVTQSVKAVILVALACGILLVACATWIGMHEAVGRVVKFVW